MKIKLLFNDGTSNFAYGDFSEENIIDIEKQMKRPQHKRLYTFGVDFS